MQNNPSYAPTTPTQPSVRYSSLGPQGTPTGRTLPQRDDRIYSVLEHPEQQREERRVYHVLEHPREREQEERVYQVVGEVGEGQEERGGGAAYEVPIVTESKRKDESAERAVENAYSTIRS